MPQRPKDNVRLGLAHAARSSKVDFLCRGGTVLAARDDQLEFRRAFLRDFSGTGATENIVYKNSGTTPH